MIVVRLCGGLGNQLFQYAAGRSLAARWNTELVLDLDWYKRTPATDTPRTFELDKLHIAARQMTATEERRAALHRGRLLRRLPWFPRAWKHVRERDANFDPALLRAPDNAYLDGYWQSPLYFEEIALLLRKELATRAAPSSQDLQVLNSMPRSRSVALHVRRGDYVTHTSAIQMHGTSGKDYYVSAMRKISEHIADPHYFVFSDDVQWARENLGFPGGVSFVAHNGPNAAVNDLHLMASCDHQVIANSSFSWWAAWLNPHPDKMVIAPGRWFADGRPTPDLIPASWIRL